MGSVSKCVMLHSSMVVNGQRVPMLDMERLNLLAQVYSDESAGTTDGNWKDRPNYKESMIQAAEYIRDEWLGHKQAVIDHVEAEYAKKFPNAAKDKGNLSAEIKGMKFSVTGKNPEDFVYTPEGGIDFGEISTDIASYIKRQPGKIRLNIGEHLGSHKGYGAMHIIAEHPDIKDVTSFVKDVASNFTEIWKTNQGRLILAKKETGEKAHYLSIIQLVPHSSGDYYSVVSSYTSRKVNGESLLWDAAHSRPDDSGIQPALRPTHQQLASDERSSAQQKEDSKSIAHPVEKAISPEVAKLNEGMVRYFNDPSWSNAYEPVPDFSNEIQQAVKVAFGRKLIAVRPTNKRAGELNGINYGGRLYINTDANVGFVNITGHELYHQLAKDRPELHEWFRDQARDFYTNFGDYQDKLNRVLQPGESAYGIEAAEEELLSDFTGDALADPKFLEQLAKADGSKFKQLLNAVITFLQSVKTRLTSNGLGSSQYFSDTEALRKHLLSVLSAYSNGRDIAAIDAFVFSRTPDLSGEDAQYSENDIRFSVAQPAPSYTLPEETSAQKTQRLFQDSDNRWNIAQEALKKQGAVITPDADVYRAMERMPSHVATQMENFERGVWLPLLERVIQAKTSMDDVALYLYASHAEERNVQIALINPRFPDGGSGMTNQEAKDVLAELTSHYGGRLAEFTGIANDFQKITDSTLTTLEASGVMSPEQVAAYRSTYAHYIPLKGFEQRQEDGSKGSGNGLGRSTARNFSKRALGRQSKAGQIIENILRDHERAILFSEKVKVGKAVRSFIEQIDDPDIGTVNVIPTSQVFSPTPAPTGQVILRVAQFDPEKEIQYIEDGQVVRLQLHDPLLTRAYNKLGENGVAGVFKYGSMMNRMLREMWTAKNPTFFLINPIRDVQQLAVNLTGEGGATLAGKAFLNWGGAWKAMHAHSRNVSAGNWQGWVDRYRASGGHTGTSYVGSLENMADKLNKQLALMNNGSVLQAIQEGRYSDAAKSGFYKAFNNRLFEAIEHLNSAFENATRLAAFKAAAESGLSDEEAGRIAKNVSVNFNRSGEFGQHLGSAYLFANANIQGSANLIRTLTESKHKGQAWAMVGTLVTAGFLAGMMADDDDDNLIPDYEKERNLSFSIGDGKRITIPLAYGWSWFRDIGRATADVYKGKDAQKVGMGLASSFFGNFSPVGNPMPEGKLDQKAAMVQLAPTSLKPFAMTGLNTNSFGSALMPDSPYKPNQPDSEKVFRSTRGTVYDLTAKGLSRVTGGDSAQAGWIDVSPETLKTTVNYILGGAGRFLTDSASMGTTAFHPGEDAKPETWPILKAFYKATSIDDFRRRFYDSSEEIKRAREIQRAYAKSNDQEAAQLFNKKYGNLASLDKQVKQYGSKIKALRDKQDAARERNNAEQVEQLEREESVLLNRFDATILRRYTMAELN